jgi:predicted DsbA family dithiol-disulfide isomerase
MMDLRNEAAESQGKFWEFHDLLFKNYNKLNDQKIQDIALEVGLDQEEYKKKRKDPAIERSDISIVDAIPDISVPSDFTTHD